jgi:peptidoglycan/LPS O-acetylase OafA/YrhL
MKLTYRPEIDGLRAIAVSAVILYHAQITILGYQPFKGGFIGVDIFFVISGYLITSIILKELVTTGSFSFKHFYERRIRRILPALLFVMLVSLPFAWMYLLPSSFVDFSKSILYSLGFSSNFYFHYSGQQYGAESGLLKPFLHTWSLSVEEQYYILFPIVLLITFKYFRKYLIQILILGFILSLGLAEWGNRNHPSFNFYVLPTRGWELLAGSILAYFEISKGHRSKNQALNLILPFTGLILIGHSIWFFNDEMFHPSFYTLSLIVGVCLIIWFSDKDEIITKILSTKLFVGIGLISYSLYLWHYPIFAFGRIIGLFLKFEYFFYLLILLTILISLFSYFFIEKKFRDKKFQFKKIFKIISALYLLIIIFSFIVILSNGFKNRFPQILNNIDAERHIFYSLRNENGRYCLDYFYCSSNNKSDKKVFLLGDSHMAAISYDLNKKLIEKNYKFIPLTIRRCYFFMKFNQIDNRTNKKIQRCSSTEIKKRYNLIKENPNSIVIIGGMLSYLLSGVSYKDFLENKLSNENILFYYKSSYSDDIKESFRKNILDLSKENQIILIYPYPEISFDITKKIQQAFFLENDKINDLLNRNTYSEPFENYLNRSKEAFDLLDSIKNKNIHKVYPHLLVCQNIVKDFCVTHNKTDIFYSDFHHPSAKASEMINDLIMKVIEKIELKSN